MGNSAIWLPRDKIFALTPLEQRVVYGGLYREFTKIYKRVRRYPSIQGI